MASFEWGEEMNFNDLEFKAEDFESVINFLEPRMTFIGADDKKVITKYTNEYLRDLVNRLLRERLGKFHKDEELYVAYGNQGIRLHDVEVKLAEANNKIDAWKSRAAINGKIAIRNTEKVDEVRDEAKEVIETLLELIDLKDEALKFYADGANWTTNDDEFHFIKVGDRDWSKEDAGFVGGKIAREALGEERLVSKLIRGKK